ncbi:MAG: formate dehydrogenase subunit alpha, partial [Armatimonadetes bacterium]|nr:formate dehydrogenase subunit alpha [Armatimonadota bacterium]
MTPSVTTTAVDPRSEYLELTLDGRHISARPGATLWEAAREAGVAIPVLCHDPGLDPVAVCRVCMVEVEGSRVLTAACVRKCESGMVVRTDTERVRRARKLVVELLMADHPSPCARHRLSRSCELEVLAEQLGAAAPRLPGTRGKPEVELEPPAPDVSAAGTVHRGRVDLSSPVIAVDHSACILCDRCIRGCDEIQVNEVIGRTEKGFAARIAFDTDLPMGESSCVSCGECMARCPTGALVDKSLVAPLQSERLQPVSSVCPYCGVGCGITMHVQDDRVVRVTGRPDGPANAGRLCVKGRYGFDYSSHPQRLTVPLIRRAEFYPKRALSV